MAVAFKQQWRTTSSVLVTVTGNLAMLADTVAGMTSEQVNAFDIDLDNTVGAAYRQVYQAICDRQKFFRDQEESDDR